MGPNTRLACPHESAALNNGDAAPAPQTVYQRIERVFGPDGADYRDLTLLSSPARNTRRSGLPANPKRSRILFSRYRRYEKCSRLVSFTKSTTVGASPEAWVAKFSLRRRPL